MAVLSGDTAAIVAATLAQAEMVRRGAVKDFSAHIHDDVLRAYEFYLEMVTKVDLAKP